MKGRAAEFLPQPLRVVSEHPPVGLDGATHQLLYKAERNDPLVNDQPNRFQCRTDQHRRILQFLRQGFFTTLPTLLLIIHDQPQGPGKIVALEGPHDFHRGRLLPLLAVVPYFDQAEEDADNHQQRTENFGYIGQVLQIQWSIPLRSKKQTPSEYRLCTPRGAVAQLGERRVRNAKVGSLILLGSTKYSSPQTVRLNMVLNSRKHGFEYYL